MRVSSSFPESVHNLELLVLKTAMQAAQQRAELQLWGKEVLHGRELHVGMWANIGLPASNHSGPMKVLFLECCHALDAKDRLS